METAILKSRSKNDLKLLLDLAKKTGIDVRQLTKEEAEETGLFSAIKRGRTRKIVNTKKYVEKLRKG
jgi:hypothetical protein